MRATLKQTTRALSKDSALAGDRTQSLEKSLVLGAGPVSHPQVARAAERSARPDGDTRLRQRLDDLALIQIAEVDPAEVRLRVGGLEAQLAERLLDEDTF